MQLESDPVQHKHYPTSKDIRTVCITLVDTCLLFADDLVLRSPTRGGLQQHLLHSFSQTWALTVNLSKNKIMIFEKRPSLNKYTFHP